MATMERIGHSRPATLEEFEALPDDGKRYELIEGCIVEMAMPNEWHQDVAYDLVVQLGPVCAGLGLKARFNRELLLSTGPTVIIPDVIVYGRDAQPQRDRYIDPTGTTLVVEIVSPSSRRHDRIVKPDVLATDGIPFYLLVDPFPQPPHFTLFGLDDGTYEMLSRVEAGQSLHLPEPFNLDLDTSEFA